MALAPKRKAFARKYAKNGGNGVKAYQDAGYKGSYNVAGVEAHKLLKNPKIVKEIERFMKEDAKADILTANEVLGGLSAKARADIADVLEADGSFNLAKAKERGKSKLIKSLKFDKDTGKVVGVELYSAHEAERDLGKFHKLFTERTETVDLTETEKHKTVIANEIHRLRLRFADDDLAFEAEVARLRVMNSDQTDPAYDPLLDYTKHPENWPEVKAQDVVADGGDGNN